MRAALYFTPRKDDPLTRRAARWLGRDAFTGERFPAAAADGFDAAAVAALTEAPRRYGFHATVKPPFWLSNGHALDDLETELAVFCRDRAPVAVVAPRVERLGSFFAITPGGPADAIVSFAADVVRHFDRFRAPPTAKEIERRRQADLTPRQQDNLVRWGYPYVFNEFRFHMTLTGEVADGAAAAVGEALQRQFAPVLSAPIVVDSLTLFIEPSPPGDFIVRRTVRFGRLGEEAGAA